MSHHLASSDTYATDLAVLQNIRIVMVNTTLAANIGAALRAMKTMGLRHLVLVSPKNFPHPDIDALSAGASDLIADIQVVETLEQAIAECEVVFGTSARNRTIPWPLLDVRPAAQEIIQAAQRQQKIAILFGREDRGLTNEELAMANYHLTIPVNPSYGVLNVAQAIQVVCYELRMSGLAVGEHSTDDTSAKPVMKLPQDQQMQWDEPLVNQAQMQQFYPHLEQTLVDIDFMDVDNPRLLPLRLRRLFGRIQLDRMEYHLLRGVFTRVQALAHGTWRMSKSDAAGSSLTTEQQNSHSISDTTPLALGQKNLSNHETETDAQTLKTQAQQGEQSDV